MSCTGPLLEKMPVRKNQEAGLIPMEKEKKQEGVWEKFYNVVSFQGSVSKVLELHDPWVTSHRSLLSPRK